MAVILVQVPHGHRHQKPRERRRPSAATAADQAGRPSDQPPPAAGCRPPPETLPSSDCPSFVIACSVLARLRPRPRRRSAHPVGQALQRGGTRVKGCCPLVTAGERFRSARLPRGGKRAASRQLAIGRPHAGVLAARGHQLVVRALLEHAAVATTAIESARARWRCVRHHHHSLASAAGWRWPPSRPARSRCRAGRRLVQQRWARRAGWRARWTSALAARQPAAVLPDARGASGRARHNPSAFARRHASAPRRRWRRAGRSGCCPSPNRRTGTRSDRRRTRPPARFPARRPRCRAADAHRAARGPVVLGDEVERRGLPAHESPRAVSLPSSHVRRSPRTPARALAVDEPDVSQLDADPVAGGVEAARLLRQSARTWMALRRS